MSETKDALLLWTFALSALLNGVILAQIVLYGGNPARSSSNARHPTLPRQHVPAAVAEKAAAVQEKLQEVLTAAADKVQEVSGISAAASTPPSVSTPKRNMAATGSSVSGSGGPGSAGRRYVRKLD